MNKFFLSVILLIGLTARAADQPKINGWRQASWGMTPEQVIAALNGEPKHPAAGKYVTTNILLEMTDVVIEKEKFTAEFLFSPDKRLIEVNLTCHAGGDDLFYALEQRLIEKYGKGNFTEDKTERDLAASNKNRKRAWNRSPTRIELTLWQLIDPEKKEVVINNLSIRYSQLKGPADDL